MKLRMMCFAFAMSIAASPSMHAQGGPPPGGGRPGQNPFADAPPSRPAQQTRFNIHLNGVSAVQLAWWFQHFADEGGSLWKPLAPDANKTIEWKVNPREDAHQLIGAVFLSDQKVGGGLFPGDNLRLLAQFEDYATNRVEQGALNPTVPIPSDYKPDYPSPMGGGFEPLIGLNGFNEDMLLLDGKGFAPGRILWSWKNTGGDDTEATAGQALGIDLTVTVYQTWMEGPNRPPALSADGYYYTEKQVAAVWSVWEKSLKTLPNYLPKWFGDDTQDTIARTKNWTVGSVIDTGLVEGVTSKMMVWWWSHAMGDEPGSYYTLWCPPAHHSIRWLPGYSPAEVLKSNKVPTDHVVPGTIYPDLQGTNGLVQNGGGMMAYPTAMSPVPGRYKTLDPMFPVTKADVDNFAQVRFPEPPGWLLHQWEDRPGGLIHRSTILTRLPLRAPVTQAQFYSEHQLLEGQNWGAGGMRKAYADWLKTHPE